MANLTITDVDYGNVLYKNNVYRNELITFAGAATLLEGTILARDSVSLKMVPFVKGGVVNENGLPKAILGYEVEATAAGDEAARPGISGEYIQERLVIAADGDASNVDAAVVDQLRVYGLVPVEVTQNGIPDNQ